MPTRPKKPCPGKGPRFHSCPNLIAAKETCCPECQPYETARNRKYDKARDNTPERRFIHSGRWQRMRDAKLNRDPLCEVCLIGGFDVPATLVHHIDGNELNNDPSNHQSLNNSCHEAIHGPERFRRS